MEEVHQVTVGNHHHHLDKHGDDENEFDNKLLGELCMSDILSFFQEHIPII